MDSLIAKANAQTVSKKRKASTTSTQDATLASIAKHSRIPKSIAEDDAGEKKKRQRRLYGHVNDLKLRAHLTSLSEHSKATKELVKDTEMLALNDAGGMEVEGELERTWKMSQDEIANAVGIETAKARKEWKLDGGPYCSRYSRNGRHLAIAGRKGHVSTFDWQTGTLHAELQLQETVRDITFLQDHTMFAVAQSKHVFMYDKNGVELHRLSNHIEPTKLEFLPYHWLLASVGLTGFLKYQDISNGQTVAEHKTKLGACRAMCQNAHNSVIQLGHQNGTVTLWTPNSPSPHVRLLAHLGPVTSVSIDPSSAGRYLATSGMDGKVKIWDCRNWKGCLRQWVSRASGAELDWSQQGMLSVASGTSVTVFRKPAITQHHRHIADPPLYLTHPITNKPLQSIRFCPFQDLLTVGHSAGLSTLIVPGAGEPNFDSAEADPFEGKKSRREREVRALLDKLAPDLITLDPEFIGSVAPDGKILASEDGIPLEVHRKLPRLERLRATGKADETEVHDPLDDLVDGEESGKEGLEGLTKEELDQKRAQRKVRLKMRGKDKSMKRYLKKKRQNVIDTATVAIRSKLEKQRVAQEKAKKAAEQKATGIPDEPRSALDRFRMG